MSKHTSSSGSTLTRSGSTWKIAKNRISRWYARGICAALMAWCPAGRAQSNNAAPASAEEVKQLRDVVQSLLVRVTELEKELKERPPAATERVASGAFIGRDVPVGGPDAAAAPTGSAAGSAAISPAVAPAQSVAAEAPKEQAIAASPSKLDFLHGATLNFALDEYYEYNFNDPVGRVNALRAYDVLSNNISLNQADVVFERAPDVSGGSPFGVRIDLQFGQAEAVDLSKYFSGVRNVCGSDRQWADAGCRKIWKLDRD
jgi:hypothetical protein